MLTQQKFLTENVNINYIQHIEEQESNITQLNKPTIQTDNIIAFNGMRGIFVLMVLFRHAFGIFGEQGVDGFFIMSGWLNAQSVDKGFQSSGFCLGSKNFFIHRFFRIVPTYYLCLLTIYLIFHGTKSASMGAGICDQNIVQNAFFITDFDGATCLPPFWTLPIEVQCYFSIPLFIYLFNDYPKIGVAALTIVSLSFFIIGTILTFCVPSDSAGDNGVTRTVSIFFGIAFYQYNKNKTLPQTTSKLLTLIPSAIYILFCIIEAKLAISQTQTNINYQPPFIIAATKYLAFSLTVGCIALGFQHYQDYRPLQFLHCNFLAYFNRISYALYLFHMIPIYVYHQFYYNAVAWIQPQLGFIVIFWYLSMILISQIISDYYEKFFNSLSRNLTQKNKQK